MTLNNSLGKFVILAGFLSCAVAVSRAADDVSWTKAQWTESDAPYWNIRKSIDAAQKNSEDSQRSIAFFRKKVRSPQVTSLDAFAYSYSVSGYTKHFGDRDIDKLDIYNSYLILKSKGSPHSYQVARHRFLLENHSLPVNKFIPLGERLISHSKNDYSICTKLALIYIDTTRLTLHDRSRALELAKRAVHLRPNKSYPYVTLGYVYRVSSFKTNSPSDLRLSIANYEKYLRMTPKTLRNRADYEKGVQQMKERLARLRHKK